MLTDFATTTPDFYEPKIIGRRGYYNTRKKAYEDAKRNSDDGKEPIHHPKGPGNKRGHFHPNVKDAYRKTPHGASYHDHYYYCFTQTTNKPKYSTVDLLMGRIDIYDLQ